MAKVSIDLLIHVRVAEDEQRFENLPLVGREYVLPAVEAAHSFLQDIGEIARNVEVIKISFREAHGMGRDPQRVTLVFKIIVALPFNSSEFSQKKKEFTVEIEPMQRKIVGLESTSTNSDYQASSLLSYNGRWYSKVICLTDLRVVLSEVFRACLALDLENKEKDLAKERQALNTFLIGS